MPNFETIYLEPNSILVSTGGLERIILNAKEVRHKLAVRSDMAQSFVRNNGVLKALSRTVDDFLVDQFSRLPEVNYVYSEQDGHVFYVWVVLKDSDEGAVDRVLDAEERVIREFQNFEFDFNVIFQMGRDVGELISPAEPLFQRS